jgi:protoporphyrinogen oxidase
VDLLEASSVVGGMARTITVWGRPVEIGPHIFAGGDARALARWKACAGPDATVLTLRRGVESPFGTLEYPFRSRDLLRRLPPSVLLRGARDLLRARATSGMRGDVDSTEEWITRRYGRTLYDVLLRSYVEKLWGSSGVEIDSAFARALLGARSAAVRSPRADDTGATETFLYPRGGASTVWEEMATQIRRGGTIALDARVSAIHPASDGAATLVTAGAITRYARLISTIPLGRLLTLLPDVPARVTAAQTSLRARNVLIVHLLVTGMARSPYLWLYVQDPALQVGRLTDTANWDAAAARGPDTVVTMEYWCSDDDALWRSDDEAVIRLAAGELRRTRVGCSSEVANGQVTRVRGALPVPQLGFVPRLDLVRRYVVGLGIETVGRHGGFTIGSMADVMAEGMQAADRVARGLRPS